VVGLGNSVGVELVDGGVQLFGRPGERVAGVAEPVRHLLPAHPAAPLAVVVDDCPAALADGPCRDRCCLDDPAVVGDLEAEACPGHVGLHQPHGPPPLPGRARRASPHRRRTLAPEHAEWPRSRVAEEKSSPKLVTCAHWPDELFSGPRHRPSTVDRPGASSSTGQRRSAGPRLGAGSQARRANARGRSTTPPPFSHHAAGRQARGGHGGAVLRRARECERPVRPGTSAARTAAQRPPAGHRLKS